MIKKQKLFLVILLLLGCSCDPKDTLVNPTLTSPLLNTQWSFLGYDSAGVYIHPLLESQYYHIHFLDSNFRGESDTSCINTYGGPYQIFGVDSIFIQYVISTRVACRESYWNYIHSLEKATKYYIRNDSLIIYLRDNLKKMFFYKSN